MYRRGEVGAVARALRVLNGLRGFKQGRTLADLAAEVCVSERTVRRDLVNLNDAGIEIELTRLEGRAAACLREASYSTVAITRRERYTLLAVRRMFDVLRGTPLAEDVSSVLRKLEQSMTEQERGEHATFGERFAYVPDGGTKIYDGKEDVLDALLTGVLHRNVVKFAYRGAQGRAQRGYLAPYAMVLHKHGLYVLGARFRELGDVVAIADLPVVNFAAERFVEAEHVRRTSFVPPSNFRLSAFLHGAFGVHVGTDAKRVVIDFSKERATYVMSRLWHQSQSIESLPDGKVRVRFTCTNLLPVVSWVLEWGPHARAIEPIELVSAVLSELREAAAQYPDANAASSRSGAKRIRR